MYECMINHIHVHPSSIILQQQSSQEASFVQHRYFRFRSTCSISKTIIPPLYLCHKMETKSNNLLVSSHQQLCNLICCIVDLISNKRTTLCLKQPRSLIGLCVNGLASFLCTRSQPRLGFFFTPTRCVLIARKAMNSAGLKFCIFAYSRVHPCGCVSAWLCLTRPQCVG